ncbi:MAG: nucleotidyltransferase domain-containing protein [Candidatus Aenigmatarchaeota archaeon]
MKEKTFDEKMLEILSLYTSNYEAKIHLREITRKIKTDTKTASLNLKKLLELKVLKSAKIGKHKEFFLNNENIVSKYFLIITEIYKSFTFLSTHFKIFKIFEMLEELADGIIIFGSYAKNIATKESDLDLLIINGNIESKRMEAENLYGIKISPKYFSTKEFIRAQKVKDILFIEVLSSHIILKGFELFVNTTWRNYYGF